jgi:hypothetical protein
MRKKIIQLPVVLAVVLHGLVRRLRRAMCKHACHLNELRRTPDGNVECPCIKCGKMLTARYGLAMTCDWRSARGDVWVNPGDITDTDRLNWLEKCLESHIIGRDSIEGDWFITLPHVAIVASKEKTLREAIDVAMTPNDGIEPSAGAKAHSKP